MGFSPKSFCDSIDTQMHLVLASLKSTLDGLKPNQLNFGLLLNLQVRSETAGQTKLKKLATITRLTAQTATIKTFSPADNLAVEEAITSTSLLFCKREGGDFLMKAPPQTAQKKVEILKLAKSECEKAKVKLRNIRKAANDAVRKAVKESRLPYDIESRLTKTIQDLTNNFSSKIDGQFQTFL
ncbi:ribosome recycling factor [Candidatus Tremblaya phenacola PAVE]|nr:ribosome recycling factor [Candidatus Tremblaya phenacola PAVE]